MHRTNTLTQLEENSDDHTYDGENRAGFKERNQSIYPSSKHRYECVGQVGCRCGMKGASLLPRRRRPAPYFSETATGAFCKCSRPALRCRRLGRTLSGNSRPLHSRAEDENGTSMIIDGVATAGKPAAISVRKPTFLQKERWKEIQKARRKGM